MTTRTENRVNLASIGEGAKLQRPQRARRAMKVLATAATVAAASSGLVYVAPGAMAAPHVTLAVKMEAQTSPAVAKSQAAFFKHLATTFEKDNPGITVDISTYTGSASPLINTMVASHSGPNVVELGTTFIPTVTSTGAFVPYTKNMLKEVNIGALVPAATRMDGVPGKEPVGVPDSAQPFALFYNKAMFAKAGIVGPPKTWSQFLTDAEKLTNTSAGVYGAVIAPGDTYYNNHITWLLAEQNGGQLIGAHGALFTSKAVAQEVQFYVDWMAKYHIVAPTDSQYTESDAVSAFIDGKAAMFPVGGLYDMAQFYDTAPAAFVKNDLGVAENPVIPYGDSATPPGGAPAPSFVSGQEQVIFKYSSSAAQVQAALRWLRFYTSAPVQKQLPKLFGTLPINKNAYSASYLQTPVWKTFEAIEEHSVPTPLLAGWLDLAAVWAPALAKVFDDVSLGHYNPSELATTETSSDQQIDTTIASLGG